MIDEIIIEEEIIAPITAGFIKMLMADFPAFNLDAKTRMLAYAPGNDMDDYTSYVPDVNPLYCWARVEEEFTSKVMTDVERAKIVDYDTALAQGMVINSGGV